MFILSIFLLGCGNDIVFDNTPDSNSTNGENQPPVANAGADKTTTIYKSIGLVGSGTDSDGQIVDYEWRENSQLISGLKDFTYLPTSEGNHTLTLTVLDDDGARGNDSMIVIVTAEANTTN
jgi:hypothetical protein